MMGMMAMRTRATLDGRYDLGVTQINEDTADDTSVRNRAWEIFAGIGFPIG